MYVRGIIIHHVLPSKRQHRAAKYCNHTQKGQKTPSLSCRYIRCASFLATSIFIFIALHRAARCEYTVTTYQSAMPKSKAAYPTDGKTPGRQYRYVLCEEGQMRPTQQL
ncbi:hypothetical protein HD806DRAFT_151272 [Xylariaceae sp. AK1471]|nr:hypothetical protein HD806DRAFT_151272 [Xylariaceae sp. AK1471]